MRVLVIDGPSLNMLGIREKEIYGNTSYQEHKSIIKEYCKDKGIKVKIVQSNYEGKIITDIQRAYKKYDLLVINPGAYAHYSYAIRDAIKCVNIPTIEVHISDVLNREDFRKELVISDVCYKTIIGKGIEGYLEAIDYLTKLK